MHQNRGALKLVVVVASVGMLVAIYDSVSRMLHIPLFCPFAGNGCDIVQNSPYAAIFGIPLAFLGVFAFAAYLLLAYIALKSGAHTRWSLHALLAWNILTICSMAYFSYLEIAVIHAICSICVFVAALDVTLGITIIYAIRSVGRETKAHAASA